MTESFYDQPFCIEARKNHEHAESDFKDCYCYDDVIGDTVPAQSIIAEPLVPSTTAVIEALFTMQDLEAPSVVTIEFGDRLGEWITKDYSNGALIQLFKAESSNGGTNYVVNPLLPAKLEDAWLDSDILGQPPLIAWLCSHLCDYFEEPPEEFFARIAAA